MSNYNFDYAALGFKNEAELQESISRVERKMKMNSDDLVREEIKERYERSSQPFSFEAMEEGARVEGLDRVVQSKILQTKEEAKLKAEQEGINKLMKAAADKIKVDNETIAQKEMQKEKEKLEAELQKEIYLKHNVKTDKQIERDEAYKSMLDGLKI